MKESELKILQKAASWGIAVFSLFGFAFYAHAAISYPAQPNDVTVVYLQTAGCPDDQIPLADGTSPTGWVCNDGTAVQLWETDGTHVWRPAGNVGIGTATPGARLTVLWPGSWAGGALEIGPADAPAGLEADASGSNSFAYGLNAKATAIYSVAFGNNTSSTAQYAYALGWGTDATGNQSFASGWNTTASNTAATAMGSGTTASGLYSFAAGSETNATGVGAIAMGIGPVKATGAYSLAVGNSADYGGGQKLEAYGNYSVAFGRNMNAIGDGSFAMGIGGLPTNTGAHGDYSVAIGNAPYASSYASTAIGFGVKALNTTAVALGRQTEASGYAAAAIGDNAVASGSHSTALGSATDATGDYSFASGRYSEASGTGAFASGRDTVASGTESTAMGNGNTASGNYSFATGLSNTASGYGSFSNGAYNGAAGNYSSTLGYSNTTNASADYSTSIGYNSDAYGVSSTAIGGYAVAEAFRSVVVGSNNITDAGYNRTGWTAADPIFVVGNGINTSSKSNALTILKNGKVGINGIPSYGLDVWPFANFRNQVDISPAAYGDTGYGLNVWADGYAISGESNDGDAITGWSWASSGRAGYFYNGGASGVTAILGQGNNALWTEGNVVFDHIYDGNAGVANDVINLTGLDNNSDGIAFEGKLAMSSNDAWLRLNQKQEFGNGVYTPGRLRVDGTFQVDSGGSTLSAQSGNNARLLVGRDGGDPSIEANTDASGYWMIVDGNRANDGKLGLNYYSGGNVIIANGGGNVGINNTSPGETVDINGDLNARNGSNSDAYLASGTYGIAAYGNNSGGYFSDWDGVGYARVGYSNRGIWGWGSFAGATFSNANNSAYWVDIATSDGYGIKTPRPITASSYSYYSDAKLKKNIQDLSGSLDKVMGLRGVSFEWKDETMPGTYLGFVAQEVEPVLPDVVGEVEGTKTINYDGIIPVLTGAIQELKEENDTLKAVVCELEPEADFCQG